MIQHKHPKNSKILKKSLKSIRDSLVATFEIAKLLKSEVSKNVKLIGEKTKKNKFYIVFRCFAVMVVFPLKNLPRT